LISLSTADEPLRVESMLKRFCR